MIIITMLACFCFSFCDGCHNHQAPAKYIPAAPGAQPESKLMSVSKLMSAVSAAEFTPMAATTASPTKAPATKAPSATAPGRRKEMEQGGGGGVGGGGGEKGGGSFGGGGRDFGRVDGWV